MGIKAQELCKRYPVLYHMASFGSWPSIEKHGLLSTVELLRLYEVPEPKSTELLTSQRLNTAPIRHAIHGNATVRDQKPLSAKNLARCLRDCDVETWYRILNERVFFWLDRQRLMTLMSAGTYSGHPHTVLQIESAALLRQYEDQVELAHMNTGNTRPFPHPRGRSTFKKMRDYPYEIRRRLPDYSAIVELTVIGGVPNIRDFVTRAEHAAEVGGAYKVSEVLYQRP